MNRDCPLNAASIPNNVTWYAEHGYVKTKPDMAMAVDDTYCQAAAAVKQLRPHKP